MNDNCNPNGCPVSAKVDALKDEFDRYRGNSSETHKQMFDRIGALEQNKAALAEKLDGIDEKLDGLTEKVESLMDKPAKRWESLVGYALSALVGAFLLWVASGMPGVGK